MYQPTEDWVKQQARNVSMWLDDQGLDLKFIVHDRDTKFPASFDHIFKAAAITIVKTPFQGNRSINPLAH